MWTETHYYTFPTAAEVPPTPAEAAIDTLGQIANNYLVNARWWGEEPAAWATYRQAAPEHPKRVFA